jgi:hypothetical protein
MSSCVISKQPWLTDPVTWMCHSAAIRPVASVLCGYPAETSVCDFLHPSDYKLWSFGWGNCVVSGVVQHFGRLQQFLLMLRLLSCERLWRGLLDRWFKHGCFHRPINTCDQWIGKARHKCWRKRVVQCATCWPTSCNHQAALFSRDAADGIELSNIPRRSFPGYCQSTCNEMTVLRWKRKKSADCEASGQC